MDKPENRARTHTFVALTELLQQLLDVCAMSRTQAVPAHMETHIQFPEVVGTFSSPKLRHEGANCEVETTNGSLGRLAQVVLEFAKAARWD
jgi:hypothetical protein